MNTIYKTVWRETTGTWVAVSEQAVGRIGGTSSSTKVDVNQRKPLKLPLLGALSLAAMGTVGPFASEAMAANNASVCAHYVGPGPLGINVNNSQGLTSTLLNIGNGCESAGWINGLDAGTLLKQGSPSSWVGLTADDTQIVLDGKEGAIYFRTGATGNILTMSNTADGVLISGLAAGIKPSDAVNMSQLSSLSTTVASKGIGVVTQDASTGTISVGAGSPGKTVDFTGGQGARKLSGVDAGVAETDAVNVSQLTSLSTATSNGLTSLSTGLFTADRSVGSLSTSLLSTTNGIASLSSSLSTVNADLKSSIGNTVSYDSASKTQITLGGVGATTPVLLTNVASGSIAATSTDAVNGSQLYSMQQGFAAKYGQLSSEVSSLSTSVADVRNSAAPGTASGGSSTATGAGSSASGNNATASGSNAAASGVNSTASGAGSKASGVGATSTGQNAAATADGTTATGNNAEASGANSTASGAGSKASGTGATSTGQNAAATADGTTATGNNAAASGVNSTASGAGSKASGTGATSTGQNAAATADGTTATGNNAEASGVNSTANGAGSKALGVSSAAFGESALATGEGSTALGGNSTASGPNSVALGRGAAASGPNSVALGAGSVANEPNTVSVGSAGHERRVTNVASGVNDTDAVNVGQLNGTVSGILNHTVTYDSASKAQVTLGGVGATTQVLLTNVASGSIAATSTDAVNGSQLYSLQQGFAAQYGQLSSQVSSLSTSVAEGKSSAAPGTTSGGNSTATGAGSSASNSNTTASGSNAAASGENSTANGAGSKASGTGATSTGQNAVATANGTTATGNNSVASGLNSTTTGAGSKALGVSSAAFGESAAATDEGSTALGGNSIASGPNSVALGRGAAASGPNSVALGAGSVANEPNTVSVGSAGHERRVTNVAAGVNDTDAVNVGQLNSTVSGIQNRMSGMQGQIDSVAHDAYSGIAAATALTMIPDVDEGKTLAVGVGTANYKGYQASALGATARVTQNLKVRVGMSYSGSNRVWGAGMSYQW
ncbi:YadA-like family protein [Burkholderia sp. BCC1972]|uniref:YadA-like family protein n=1 Tax=Burkholderia sp. BCC1972 TaxID=2817438 RepID=UPI002ABD14D5|nr:YadA-like family protein [Burkholderia sp. BCC1972]